jgi:hypothetical protein
VPRPTSTIRCAAAFSRRCGAAQSRSIRDQCPGRRPAHRQADR